MKLRKSTAALALAAGALGGAVALSAPAWAACSVSASAVTNGMVGTGTRSGCAGSNVQLQSRVMKNVVAFPDAPVAYAYKTLQNGSVSAYGHCGMGGGTYYTWVLTNGSSTIESTRRDLCY